MTLEYVNIVFHCIRCNLLYELYNRTPKSERDYWIMTELFVLLHDSDICRRKL